MDDPAAAAAAAKRQELIQAGRKKLNKYRESKKLARSPSINSVSSSPSSAAGASSGDEGLTQNIFAYETVEGGGGGAPAGHESNPGQTLPSQDYLPLASQQSAVFSEGNEVNKSLVSEYSEGSASFFSSTQQTFVQRSESQDTIQLPEEGQTPNPYQSVAEREGISDQAQPSTYEAPVMTASVLFSPTHLNDSIFSEDMHHYTSSSVDNSMEASTSAQDWWSALDPQPVGGQVAIPSDAGATNQQSPSEQNDGIYIESVVQRLKLHVEDSFLGKEVVQCILNLRDIVLAQQAHLQTFKHNELDLSVAEQNKYDRMVAAYQKVMEQKLKASEDRFQQQRSLLEQSEKEISALAQQVAISRTQVQQQTQRSEGLEQELLSARRSHEEAMQRERSTFSAALEQMEDREKRAMTENLHLTQESEKLTFALKDFQQRAEAQQQVSLEEKQRLSKEILALENALNVERQETERAFAESSAQRDHIRRLEDGEEDLQREKMEISEALANTRAELEAFKETEMAWREDNAALSEEVEKLKERLAAQNGKLESLLQDRQHNEEQLSERMARIIEEKEAVKRELEQTIEGLEIKAREDRQRFEKEVERLREDLRRTSSALENLQERALKEREQANAELEILKGKEKNRSELISRMEENILRLEAERVAERERDLLQFESLQEELKSSHAQERSNLQDQLSTHYEEEMRQREQKLLQAGQDSLNQFKEELGRAHEARLKALQEAESLRQSIAESSEKQEELQKEITRLTQTWRARELEMERQISFLRDEKRDTAQKLERDISQLSTERSEREEILERELSSALAAAKEKEAELQQQIAKISDELREQKDRHEREIARLAESARERKELLEKERERTLHALGNSSNLEKTLSQEISLFQERTSSLDEQLALTKHQLEEKDRLLTEAKRTLSIHQQTTQETIKGIKNAFYSLATFLSTLSESGNTQALSVSLLSQRPEDCDISAIADDIKSVEDFLLEKAEVWKNHIVLEYEEKEKQVEREATLRVEALTKELADSEFHCKEMLRERESVLASIKELELRQQETASSSSTALREMQHENQALKEELGRAEIALGQALSDIEELALTREKQKDELSRLESENRALTEQAAFLNGEIEQQRRDDRDRENEETETHREALSAMSPPASVEGSEKSQWLLQRLEQQTDEHWKHIDLLQRKYVEELHISHGFAQQRSQQIVELLQGTKQAKESIAELKRELGVFGTHSVQALVHEVAEATESSSKSDMGSPQEGERWQRIVHLEELLEEKKSQIENLGKMMDIARRHAGEVEEENQRLKQQLPVFTPTTGLRVRASSHPSPSAVPLTSLNEETRSMHREFSLSQTAPRKEDRPRDTFVPSSLTAMSARLREEAQNDTKRVMQSFLQFTNKDRAAKSSNLPMETTPPKPFRTSPAFEQQNEVESRSQLSGRQSGRDQTEALVLEEKEREALTSQIESLRTQNELYKKETEQLQESLSLQRQETKRCHSEIELLIKVLEECRGTMAQLEQQIIDLRDQNGQSSLSKAREESQVAILTSRVRELEVELKQVSTLLTAAQEALTKTERAKLELEERWQTERANAREEKKAQEESQQKDLLALREEESRLRERNSKLESKNARLSREVKRFTEQQSLLEMKLKLVETRSQENTSESQKAHETVLETQMKLSEAVRDKERLANEVTTLQNLVSELQLKLGKQSQLLSQKDKLNTDVEHLQEEVRWYRSANESLIKSLSDAEVREEHEKNSRKQAQKQAADALEQLERLKEKQGLLQQQLQQLDRMKDDKIERREEDLRRTIDFLQRKLHMYEGDGATGQGFLKDLVDGEGDALNRSSVASWKDKGRPHKAKQAQRPSRGSLSTQPQSGDVRNNQSFSRREKERRQRGPVAAQNKENKSPPSSASSVTSVRQLEKELRLIETGPSTSGENTPPQLAASAEDNAKMELLHMLQTAEKEMELMQARNGAVPSDLQEYVERIRKAIRRLDSIQKGTAP